MVTSSKLLNPHQSAYCKHHSTETALFYIHDHLINAIHLLLGRLFQYNSLTNISYHHATNDQRNTLYLSRCHVMDITEMFTEKCIQVQYNIMQYNTISNLCSTAIQLVHER